VFLYELQFELTDWHVDRRETKGMHTEFWWCEVLKDIHLEDLEGDDRII
jgi:hypothetical protein